MPKREVKESVIKEMIASCDRHIKKYGFRSTSIKELEKLCKAKSKR